MPPDDPPVDTRLFGGGTFEVGDVTFVSAYGASTADRFCVLKTQDQLAHFLELCRRFAGGTVVELGIASGGSTALLALVAAPSKLVAIDLAEEPVPALQQLIERKRLDARVRPHYGVDQADREAVLAVLDQELDGASVDLAIDDASHLLGETRASFETIFPLLRPGGLYVIEDWNSFHLAADRLDGTDANGIRLPTPLSPLVMELLLLRASSGDVVAELVVGDLWVTVERGPAPLDPRTFRVRDGYRDHFGLVSPAWHDRP